MTADGTNNVMPPVWLPWSKYTEAQKKAEFLECLEWELDNIKFFKERVTKGTEQSNQICWNIIEMGYESYKMYKFILDNFDRYKNYDQRYKIEKQAKIDCGWNNEPFERTYEKSDTGVHNNKQT